MPANMISDEQLEEFFHIWHKQGLLQEGDPGHIDEARIFGLAHAENMAAATDHEIDHLSTCPTCMEDWSFWVRVRQSSDNDMDMDFPAVLSGGMLRAAASPGGVEALRLQSFCGRFMLGILPEIDNPEKAMITLETVADSDRSLDARTAEVRDANHRIILTGRFAQGRIAGICDHVNRIDLGAWTLIIR